jgi:hypothetical protein
MNKFLHHIAGKFPVHGNPEKILPLEDGFINETYQVFLHNQKDPAYILQKKNKNVFRDVPSMMENIRKVSLHLKRKVADRGGDTKREAITMLPALSGEYYYVDESGEFWTLCEYTTNSITYQQVVSRDLAFFRPTWPISMPRLPIFCPDFIICPFGSGNGTKPWPRMQPDEKVH